MQVHLVDGTYELFRYHFALPSHVTARRARGGSHPGRARHGVAAASRRAPPTSGWRPTTSSSRSATTCGPGTRPAPACPPSCSPSSRWLEEGLAALGVAPCSPWSSTRPTTPWRRPRRWPRPTTGRRPGAHLHAGQGPGRSACVGDRVVQLDRRKGVVLDADGGARQVRGRRPSRSPTTSASWATAPTGSPACRAGGPSQPRRCWPATATSRTSRRTAPTGTSNVRGGAKLAVTLREQFDLALLFRRIATIELDAPTITSVDELEWRGPRPERSSWSSGIDAPAAHPGLARAAKLAEAAEPETRSGRGLVAAGLARRVLGARTRWPWAGPWARPSRPSRPSSSAVAPSLRPFSNSPLAEPSERASLGSLAPPKSRTTASDQRAGSARPAQRFRRRPWGLLRPKVWGESGDVSLEGLTTAPA